MVHTAFFILFFAIVDYINYNEQGRMSGCYNNIRSINY